MIVVDKVEIDVSKSLLLSQGKYLDGYSKIYYKSNENLKKIFKNFSVKEKEVLTVLSSSDQYFYAYYLGAKKVDSFDCNKLCEYYFYLRKWLIEFKSEFHFSKEEMLLNNDWLYNLLRTVKCYTKEEKDAYRYWLSYLKFLKIPISRNLFYFSSEDEEQLISDIKKLKRKLENTEFNFKYLNICHDIDIKKKYDVIILSNILETLTFHKNSIIKCRDNLESILKDDGIIVASHLMNRSGDYYEMDIFKEVFEVEEFPYCKTKDSLESVPVGCCYRKK